MLPYFGIYQSACDFFSSILQTHPYKKEVDKERDKIQQFLLKMGFSLYCVLMWMILPNTET